MQTSTASANLAGAGPPRGCEMNATRIYLCADKLCAHRHLRVTRPTPRRSDTRSRPRQVRIGMQTQTRVCHTAVYCNCVGAIFGTWTAWRQSKMARAVVWFLLANAASVHTFATLRNDPASLCVCDAGLGLGGTCEGAAPVIQADKCARCYISRRSADNAPADLVDACRDRWESQIRWMCMKGGQYAAFANSRLADESPNADYNSLGWSRRIAPSGDCESIQQLTKTTGRTCSNFTDFNVQISPDSDGFSSEDCSFLTAENIEPGRVCADYFIFARSSESDPFGYPAIDYAQRCTENPSYSNVDPTSQFCLSAPVDGQWTDIAYYCPLGNSTA
eukprot:2442031-Pleurochrysis_carterae.AAC.4